MNFVNQRTSEISSMLCVHFGQNEDNIEAAFQGFWFLKRRVECD